MKCDGSSRDMALHIASNFMASSRGHIGSQQTWEYSRNAPRFHGDHVRESTALDDPIVLPFATEIPAARY